MVQLNDLTVSFARFVMPNITLLFEREFGISLRSHAFLTQEHTLGLLNCIYNVGKGDPKIFGALILFAPISAGLLDVLVQCDELYSDVFMASCFDTGLIENLCAPQPPSVPTFLRKLNRLIYPGAPDSRPSK